MSVYNLCECFFRLTGAEAKAIFKVLLVCVSFSHFFLPLVPLYLLLLLCPLGPPSPLSTLATVPTPHPGHSPALSLSLLSFSALELPPTLLLSQVLLTIVPSFSFHVFSFPL